MAEVTRRRHCLPALRARFDETMAALADVRTGQPAKKIREEKVRDEKRLAETMEKLKQLLVLCSNWLQMTFWNSSALWFPRRTPMILSASRLAWRTLTTLPRSISSAA